MLPLVGQSEYTPRCQIRAAPCRVTLRIRLFRVAFPAIVHKHGIVHKTGSTERITKPPEEHRATESKSDERACERTVYRSFVLEADDGDDDHDGDQCEPEVDDEQTHVDWLAGRARQVARRHHPTQADRLICPQWHSSNS